LCLFKFLNGTTTGQNVLFQFPTPLVNWYVVNPDNTFGKGFSWITAPEFDVAALNDIGTQHEVTISQGYQTTVELMNANSNVKYGDDY
jgi:hypothetical protein